MSRILILAIVFALLLVPPANAYELAQPAQLPAVQIIEGEGIGYTRAGEPISLSADLAGSRSVYLHELGHHVDYLIPESDPFRYRFRELIGDMRPWRGTQTVDGQIEWQPNSPHEKFAEAYSLCSRRDPAKVTLRWLRWDYGYDYRPSVQTHRKVCRTIENATARYPHLFS
jgi:hypothetical protein